MRRLEGKTALVTGASRGIGRGIAVCLAREGADIVVNYNSHRSDAEETARQVAELGRQALIIQADAGDPAAQERMFTQAVSHFSHVDIAVANAKYEKIGAVVDLPWEDALATWAVCQFGVYRTCQLAAQQMIRQHAAGRPGGKIVIIGSVQVDMTPAGTAPYTMAKSAINCLGRILALELAPYHINVNTINPGWIDTPGEHDLLGDATVAAGHLSIPWRRMGAPADIGEAAVFLASDAADYVTGATLRVDGGFVLGMEVPRPQH